MVARGSPTLVLGGHHFVDLFPGGGSSHWATCGMTSGGTVLCWGKSYQDFEHQYWLEPTALPEDPGVLDVFVGPRMICGLTGAGALFCLGDLDDHILEATGTMTRVDLDMQVATVALGGTQKCLVTGEGEVYCWGQNLVGQLGSGGGATEWNIPVPVWDPGG